MPKLLRLGNKNKRVCFVFRSTFRNFVPEYGKRKRENERAV